jgi:hypothetical protein
MAARRDSLSLLQQSLDAYARIVAAVPRGRLQLNAVDRVFLGVIRHSVDRAVVLTPAVARGIVARLACEFRDLSADGDDDDARRGAAVWWLHLDAPLAVLRDAADMTHADFAACIEDCCAQAEDDAVR